MVDIDPMARSLLWHVSNQFADRYVGEIFLPTVGRAIGFANPSITAVRDGMSEPNQCLRLFLYHYAFSRRGKDRGELSDIAVEALDRCLESDELAIVAGQNGERFWESFVEVCGERHRRPSEQLNIGLIAGMAELAQEIYQEDGLGSIAGWVVRQILRTDRVESPFLRMVDIRGVGPKTTSTFLRDVVFVAGLEDQLDHQDRLYVQPIDRWMRLMAPYVVPDIDDDRCPDWILAGKVSKYARHAGVSGIRFNMGTTYFGLRLVHEPDLFHVRLSELVEV